MFAQHPDETVLFLILLRANLFFIKKKEKVSKNENESKKKSKSNRDQSLVKVMCIANKKKLTQIISIEKCLATTCYNVHRSDLVKEAIFASKERQKADAIGLCIWKWI